MKRYQLKNSFLLLLTAAIWGSAFVAQSVGMDYVKPFTFNGIRSAIGALFLIPCIFLFRNHTNSSEVSPADQLNQKTHTSSSIDRKTLFFGGLCCGIVLAAASSLQQIGISYTSVGKAGFLTAIYIVLVPILSLFLKKRCSPLVWLSVALAVGGLYLLSVPDGFGSIGKGDLLLIAGSFLFAVHILVIDYFSPRCNGVALSCIQFFVCAVVCLIPAFIFEQPSLSSILAAWAPILYAGVLSYGVGYTLQIIGQKGMNPTIASLILSLESAISVLAGWLILGQTLSARELTGCAIVFLAIVLAQLPWPPTKNLKERHFMDRTLTYTVSIEESDLRADQFLSRRGFSSHLLTRLRKNMEHLLINGTPSRTNTPLHQGDILTVHIVEEHSSYHVPPVKLPLSIVYEDEDILVANKPAKMPIHPSMDNYYNSLANALAWYYRDSGNFIFRCTNRLDRDTSGLTVIAKNMLSSAVLSDMAVRHAITREYLAIVRGVVTPASGTITAPLSRKPGSIIERCVDFEHGERAVTHYKTLETKNGHSLVSLQLETGRTHQIRIHMKYLGFPLVGDYLYNPDMEFITRQALHSCRLSFEHPITHVPLCFEAPLPDDMKRVLEP